MGAWGFGILESDNALDAICDIADIIKCSDLYPIDIWDEKTTVCVSKAIENWQKDESDFSNMLMSKFNEYDGAYFIMVLAVLWLRTGKQISESIGSIFIKACDQDPWMNSPDACEKRRKAIIDLKTKIKCNMLCDDATIITVDSKGLFETIIDGMNHERV